MEGKADDYLITVSELADVIRAGQKAYKEGKLTIPDGDPHGVVDTFASRYEANLKLMHPEEAAREAMAVVDAYLKSSKFIDMSSKSSAERVYMRVDKKPEEMKE